MLRELQVGSNISGLIEAYLKRFQLLRVSLRLCLPMTVIPRISCLPRMPANSSETQCECLVRCALHNSICSSGCIIRFELLGLSRHVLHLTQSLSPYSIMIRSCRA